MKTTMEFVSEIFDSTVGMTDEEYIDFLVEIIDSLNDAIEMRRSEIDTLFSEDE